MYLDTSLTRGADLESLHDQDHYKVPPAVWRVRETSLLDIRPRGVHA